MCSGFLTTVEVNLVNTSLVPLNFQLVMSEDGDYPAVAGTEENADFLLHSRPDNRKPQVCYTTMYKFGL